MAIKTNCKVNGKDYYRVFLELGKDSNGKRKTKVFYGKGKADAEQKKKEYENILNNGLTTDKVYLGDCMKMWLFDIVKISGIKPSSFARYEGVYKKYMETSQIASIELKELQPINIQKYYNKLFKEDTSSYSIKYMNKLLKQFLNYAMDNNYIIKNPCDGKKITIPIDGSVDNFVDKEVQVFTDKEISLMASAKEDTKIKYIALISFATGMRRGEILGLKENDIDYKNNQIQIRRTVSTTTIFDKDNNKSKQTIVQIPKTKGSIRDIPLPASLIKTIKAAITLKKKEQLRAGDSYNTDKLDFIFLSTQGEFINAGNIDKSWIYFLKRLGIAHKKFHSLRHTYATRQFENDIKLKTVSKLLGHSDIDITANTYTHVLKKETEKVVDILSDIKSC